MDNRLSPMALAAVFASILFVTSTSNAQPLCQSDRLDIKHRPQMVQAATGLKIEMEQIRFQACARQSFSTSMIGSSVTINYPSNMQFETIVGALTHELGHVYQLRRAGSMAKLRQELDGSQERIELGADFLAGFVFRHFVTGASRADFQASVSLVGDYDDASGSSHGKPEERTGAFRMGYYYQGEASDVDGANRFFQRDGFGTIKAVSVL